MHGNGLFRLATEPITERSPTFGLQLLKHRKVLACPGWQRIHLLKNRKFGAVLWVAHAAAEAAAAACAGAGGGPTAPNFEEKVHFSDPPGVLFGFLAKKSASNADL